MNNPYPEELKNVLNLNPINVIRPHDGIYSKGVPHRFSVYPSHDAYGAKLTEIQFQDGALKEEHIDGVHNEDLIMMVISRLQAFQKGNFACRENAIALTKLEEALMWLSARTLARKQRGVEGQNQI